MVKSGNLTGIKKDLNVWLIIRIVQIQIIFIVIQTTRKTVVYYLYDTWPDVAALVCFVIFNQQHVPSQRQKHMHYADSQFDVSVSANKHL